jgi:glutaredoxin
MTKISLEVVVVVFVMTAMRLTNRAAGFIVRSATTTNYPTTSVSRRTAGRRWASVTGTVYYEANDTAPTVKLFTKDGCTLCDKVKDVLAEVRGGYPHTLIQVDITDTEHNEWFAKYKYDIPVLHLEDKFWIKHRTTSQEVMEGFQQLRAGSFEERKGEPDAGAMERRTRQS